MISSSSSGGGERPLGARGLETSPRGTRSWTPRCSGHQKRTKNNNVSTCACHPSARVMRIREHKTHRGGCPRVVTHGATPHPPLRPSRGILANEPRVLQLWPACPWLLRRCILGPSEFSGFLDLARSNQLAKARKPRPRWGPCWHSRGLGASLQAPCQRRFHLDRASSRDGLDERDRGAPTLELGFLDLLGLLGLT